jgi:hypothetical protein
MSQIQGHKLSPQLLNNIEELKRVENLISMDQMQLQTKKIKSIINSLNEDNKLYFKQGMRSIKKEILDLFLSSYPKESCLIGGNMDSNSKNPPTKLKLKPREFNMDLLDSFFLSPKNKRKIIKREMNKFINSHLKLEQELIGWKGKVLKYLNISSQTSKRSRTKLKLF